MKDDTLKLLGKLVEGDPSRDAVHIAVIPVTADEFLMPGMHVGLRALDRTKAWFGGNRIGIVDPFLTKSVLKGERFWLYLYPGSITSLKHVWTHPLLEDQG